jgi:glucose-6-phosphate-specific signal transduction histidine kinase
VSIVDFSIFAASVLVVTKLFGGVPWLVIASLGLAAHYDAGRKWFDAALLAGGLVWLVAFHLTDNRQLFFPFSMYLALYVASLLTERSAWVATGCGALVVMTFMAIRVLQYATARVLKVELLAAVAILAVFELIYLIGPRKPPARSLVVLFASLAAVAALAL